jgi:hypothetical protein
MVVLRRLRNVVFNVKEKLVTLFSHGGTSFFRRLRCFLADKQNASYYVHDVTLETRHCPAVRKTSETSDGRKRVRETPTAFSALDKTINSISHLADQ